MEASYGINRYHPIRVHTTRGMLEMAEIRPGDQVYEFNTSRRLIVRDIISNKTQNVYEVVYSDGRTQIICSTSPLIWDGKHIISFHHIHGNGPTIVVKPLDFVGDNIINPLFPDALIAGALITHGDYDDEYINLPLDRDSVDNHFAHLYDLDFAEKLGVNRVYYKFNGAPSDSVITWKEFFSKYDFYATSKYFGSPLIPDDYTRATIEERWHYVQGAFEVGYSIETFPNSLSIGHTNERRLLEFQKMLWSLGIMSKVSYDPNMIAAHGRKYRLDVTGDLDQYPGFFYDAWNIQQVINENIRRNMIRTEPTRLCVIGFRPIGRGNCCDLVLEQPHRIYYTENFLPRVSL